MTDITPSLPFESPLGSTTKNNDHIGIVIPCKVEQFGDFITGLIGKPQTVKGEVDGVFDVGVKDISNSWHLIHQRVTKQNDGTLASFEIRVTYDNGTSVSHKSVVDFESYYPTLPGKPEEIVLSFVYLIKFQDRQVPEKQEIDVVFNTSPNKNEKRQKWYAGGVIEWRIRHSERTWASDINGLLKNHANHCIAKGSGFWKWFRRYYEEVVHYFGVLVLASVVVNWLFSTFAFLETGPSYLQIAKYYTVSGVVLFLIYIFIGTLVRTVAVHLLIKKESFICLIDKDFDYKEKQRKKSFQSLVIYFISFIVASLSGVVGNYIYNLDWAKGF